ncbi:MAG: hypothetical protein AAF333_13150 [Planctomycetota bacterium]
MPELTPDQLEALAVDYDDMAATLALLARRYAPDPADRGLADLVDKITAYRAAAARLRTLKGSAT